MNTAASRTSGSNRLFAALYSNDRCREMDQLCKPRFLRIAAVHAPRSMLIMAMTSTRTGTKPLSRYWRLWRAMRIDLSAVIL